MVTVNPISWITVARLGLTSCHPMTENWRSAVHLALLAVEALHGRRNGRNGAAWSDRPWRRHGALLGLILLVRNGTGYVLGPSPGEPGVFESTLHRHQENHSDPNMYSY